MFHEFFGFIFGEQDSEFGVDADVGPLEVHSTFEETDDFIGNTESLVVSDKFVEVVRVDDDIHTGDRGESEFSSLYAGHAELFPCFRGVSFLSRIDGGLELLESDQTRGDFRVVFYVCIQNLSCFV